MYFWHHSPRPLNRFCSLLSYQTGKVVLVYTCLGRVAHSRAVEWLWALSFPPLPCMCLPDLAVLGVPLPPQLCWFILKSRSQAVCERPPEAPATLSRLGSPKEEIPCAPGDTKQPMPTLPATLYPCPCLFHLQVPGSLCLQAPEEQWAGAAQGWDVPRPWECQDGWFKGTSIRSGLSGCFQGTTWCPLPGEVIVSLCLGKKGGGPQTALQLLSLLGGHAVSGPP